MIHALFLLSTLCPQVETGQQAEAGEACVFTVGWNEPIAPGLPARDTVLCDSPAGMTFQYRYDDLCLLAVRAGRVPEELTPLGDVWFLRKKGNPGATFHWHEGSAWIPLRASAPGMTTGGRNNDLPGFRYSLVAPDGVVLLRVRESLRPESLQGGRGFVRSFELIAERDVRLSLDVLDLEGEGVRGFGMITSGPPSLDDWSLKTAGRDQSGARRYGSGCLANVWSRPDWVRVDDEARMSGELKAGIVSRVEVATFVLDAAPSTIEEARAATRAVHEALRR